MRLIDADELRDIYTGVPNGVYTTGHIVTAIDECKTVDAVPVKHGNWEEPQPEGAWLYDKMSYVQCSVCKKKSYFGWKDNYCRHCGAKMGLEEQKC